MSQVCEAIGYPLALRWVSVHLWDELQVRQRLRVVIIYFLIAYRPIYLFIKSRQLVDETSIKIKIQLIQNEIKFKDRLCAFAF